MSRTRSPELLRGEDVELLKQWLKKQPHMPHDIDHEILTSFVHGTKSLEIAKQKLERYLSLRSHNPKMFDFTVRDPLDPSYKKASLALKKFFLPKATPEGYRILFHVITPQLNECLVHSQEVIRTMMLLELGMFIWPEMTGFLFVYDLNGITASIMKKLSPGSLSLSLQWVQGSFPVKMKGGFIINAPSFVEMITENMVKPFLKGKLFERILVRSEGESFLKKHIPEEMLPSDYGGLEKSSSELDDYWMDMLIEKREWFKRTSQQMVDEKKRPPDATNTYGVEGTFRKLALD